MNDYSEYNFKVPQKMTNEWIDYAENRQIRTPYKYSDNSGISNNNNNSSNKNNNLMSNSLLLNHHENQNFNNKSGIKQYNITNNRNINSSGPSLLKQLPRSLLKGEINTFFWILFLSF